MDPCPWNTKTSGTGWPPADAILRCPLPGDTPGRARFEACKCNYGLANRADIQTRADLIDADEGRLP